MILIELGKEI